MYFFKGCILFLFKYYNILWVVQGRRDNFMKLQNNNIEPFVWGHGERILEMFLEPTCPYSAKAFGKIDELVSKAGENQLKVIVRFQSQPWHLFSGIVIRAILAASIMEDGRNKAISVMKAVFAHREDFEFIDHCSGPNMATTPNDIIRRISTLSGCDVSATFQHKNLQNRMKWQAKYARQNGIHVSPTFMIDGVVAPKMSSGDNIEEWILELENFTK